jgi:hypothetical protein
MIAAGVAHNPDYGKMAADSIAKEVEERNLLPKSASTQAAGGAQVAPATASTDLSRP